MASGMLNLMAEMPMLKVMESESVVDFSALVSAMGLQMLNQTVETPMQLVLESVLEVGSLELELVTV